MLSWDHRPLKTYTLHGTNWDRRISFTMEIDASSAQDAVRIADQQRRDTNKVVANVWRTTPSA